RCGCNFPDAKSMAGQPIHEPDSSASAASGPEPQHTDLTRGRFVVLRHSAPADVHFDLMFEQAGSLTTWRSPCCLSEAGGQPIRIGRASCRETGGGEAGAASG